MLVTANSPAKSYPSFAGCGGKHEAEQRHEMAPLVQQGVSVWWQGTGVAVAGTSRLL